MVSAPFDSCGEYFSNSAGSENELIAVSLPFLKVIDKCLIRFATVRPFTETKGAVKVNGDNLIVAFYGGLLSLVVLFVQIREEYRKSYFKIISQAEYLINEMARNQGVTENLKAEDMMRRIGLMNNIRTCADEIVLNDIVYF